MDCKLEQAELVGIFDTDYASCVTLASRRCSTLPSGLTTCKERFSNERTGGGTTDNEARCKNADPHVIIDHKNQSLKNHLSKHNTTVIAKPHLGEALTCVPLFWVSIHKEHALWQQATVYKWTFNVLRQARAESIVFEGILQTGTESLDRAEIRIQISYTLNWRNEWVVRHAYEAKTDVRILVTQGVMFPLTRTSYEKLKEKFRIIIEKKNICPLLDVKCLTDTEEHMSLHAIPREFSNPPSPRLHDNCAGKNVAGLGGAYQVKWGKRLHHWFSVPLVKGRGQIISNVDIYSDATASYGSLKKIGQDAYLYLDVHSFLPWPKKKNPAVENFNPKYKNAPYKNVPYLPVWTLRREKRYQYTTIYRFA